MASSKEFKRAIREGRLNDAFAIAMGNAPELHITTWIADSGDRNTRPRGGECLRTHVNLVEGEIINEIGEELIGDSLYGTLQQFHLQQVTQGHQTISQNLQSIQQMFRLLAVLQKQQKGEKYTPIDAWKISDTSIVSASVSPTSLNPNLSPESTDFSLAADSDELPFSDGSEEDVLNDLLSLDELDIEIEKSDNNPNLVTTNQKEEDWGDWLDEDSDNPDLNAEMLDLEGIELDESEDWQEDWGDETEFMSNASLENKEEE